MVAAIDDNIVGIAVDDTIQGGATPATHGGNALLDGGTKNLRPV